MSDSLRLLAGVPTDIEVCKVYHKKLKDIAEIGEVAYNQYLSAMLVDKSAIPSNENVDVSNLDIALIACLSDQDFRLIFLEAMKFFTGENLKLDDRGLFYFDSQRYFTFESFELFQNAIRIQNYVKSSQQEEEIVAGNKRAQEFMNKLKAKKEKLTKVKKQNVNLASIVSGVAWKSNSIGIRDIWDLTIYQLYDAYYRLTNIDEYNHITTGIYSGTVDKGKVKMDTINWAKTLDY